MTFVCPVCSNPINYAGEADYSINRVLFKTPMFYCQSCDLYARDIDNKKMLDHFYSASYTSFDYESRFWHQRNKFFELILSLIKKHFNITSDNLEDASKINIIDLGSSYGHFLKIANNAGFNTIGVEINEDLVKYCNEQGHTAFSSLEQIPPKIEADVFTLIDSICCIPNPREVLGEIKNRLKPDGILVLRDCNRNLYAGLKAMFQREKDFSILGAAVVSYSVKSFKKLFEEVSGFEIIEIIPEGGFGKNMPFRKRMFYSGTYFMTKLLANQIIFTPGVIIIAKPKP